MAAKDWDLLMRAAKEMKDKAQQMTLTIRTVDGWQLRITDRAEEALLALENVRPDSFARLTQGGLTYWIKPMHIASITVSYG